MIISFFIQLLQFSKNSFLLKRKYKNLKIGLSSQIYSSTLGKNNFFGNNVVFLNSSIGDFSYVSFSSVIVNAEIGKFCSIGPHVMIGIGKHPSSDFVSSSPYFFSGNKKYLDTFADKSYFNESAPILIGNDVWIGANAIIMNGIKIGNGAIVGAGSIVTRDVADYSIVVGSPAKEIKKRFCSDEILFLLKDKWWDKDHSFLKDNFKTFHNIQDYIRFVNK